MVPDTTERKVSRDFDNVFNYQHVRERCLLCGQLTVAQEACKGRKKQGLPGRHVTQDMMTC